MPEIVAELIARHVEGVLAVAVAIVLAAFAGLWVVVARFIPSGRGRVMLAAAAGLSCAAGASLLFVELADEVGDGPAGALVTFDTALSDALRVHVAPGTLEAFALVTHIGDTNFLIGIGAVVFVVLLVGRQRHLAVAWACATAGGGILNTLLKATFERSRPLHDHGLVVETGWSFPSGHASGSMLVYGMLGYLLVRHARPVLHIPLAGTAIIAIALVGASRVILQVHYLSDVVAGYLSAAAWVAACIVALEAWRWRAHRFRTTAARLPDSTPPRP